jgi:hypothetical protein|tara:strand:+ start:424 stop:681 length:258 start_codon:yes stop_codon:yes gene_type:complete
VSLHTIIYSSEIDTIRKRVHKDIRCPFKYKYELVEWFCKTFDDSIWHSSKILKVAENMSKVQLIAIWYRKAEKEAEEMYNEDSKE